MKRGLPQITRVSCEDAVCAGLLDLVRAAFGDSLLVAWQEVDWAALNALADRQGLTAVVWDGICKKESSLGEEGCGMPQELKLRWIGEVVQGYERVYDLYRRTIGEMAAFYNAHGFKMMVLKGYACSLDWPQPGHRPCGDIDIWLFDRQVEADAELAKERGVGIDHSHHHHTVFEWNGFTVENHYDFLNVHHHRSNRAFEKIFKELGRNDNHYVEVDGERVYLPSPNLHALFLLKHAMAHFAAQGISLRQLLDWGFHAKAHTDDIDWRWIEGVLDRYGMLDLYKIFNAICVEDLGFAEGVFPDSCCDAALKSRVLNEILIPEFEASLPKGMLRRVVYKYRRWRGNAWKHELCYRDSMASAFWHGVWNHLLKPTSI